MKSLHSILPVSAALALAPLSLAPAQEAKTVPVGVVTLEFQANSRTAFSLPLLQTPVFSGLVASATTNSVTTSGSNNFAEILSQDIPYFIEIVSAGSEFEGHRFDINRASTLSSGPNVLVLDTSGTSNSTLNHIPDLSGENIVVRPHWTISDIFGTGGSEVTLQSGTSPTNADQILVWSNGEYSSYWFRRNSAGTIFEWRNTRTGTTNQDKAILPPGSGFILVRKNPEEGFEVFLTGEVRTNATIQRLKPGLNLMASGYPVDISPQEASYNISNNFTAGTSPTSADQLLVWSGTEFVKYWYRSNVAGTIREWRSTSTGTVSQDATKFLEGATGFFITSSNEMTHRIQRPFPAN